MKLAHQCGELDALINSRGHRTGSLTIRLSGRSVLKRQEHRTHPRSSLRPELLSKTSDCVERVRCLADVHEKPHSAFTSSRPHSAPP